MNICISSKLSLYRPDKSKVPFIENVSLMRDAGFTETDYTFTTADIMSPGWNREFKDRVRILADNGISIRYTHLPFDYPSEETPESMNRFLDATKVAIEETAESGAVCSTIHPHAFFQLEPDYDPVKEYDQAISFLVPYVEYAKKCDVKLALENMRSKGRKANPPMKRFGMEVDDIIRCADELGIGNTWDTGHGNISEQEQYTSICKLGKRLLEVHFNDNFAEGDVHIAAFTGNLEWERVINGLREIGFDGSINMELSCKNMPMEVRPAYARYIAETAKYLAGRIGK